MAAHWGSSLLFCRCLSLAAAGLRPLFFSLLVLRTRHSALDRPQSPGPQPAAAAAVGTGTAHHGRLHPRRFCGARVSGQWGGAGRGWCGRGSPWFYTNLPLTERSLDPGWLLQVCRSGGEDPWA